MKRSFYVMFACVCAILFASVPAQAQVQSGDIITISSGSNYLAVDNAGNDIVNKTKVDKYCYWEVTISGSTYSFRSLTADAYLCMSYYGSLSLEDNGSFTLDDNKFYQSGYYDYYIRYNNGWTSTTSSNSATTLTLTEVEFTEISLGGFTHSKGVTGDALNAKGYQQVHTAERTIYYAEGDEIALILPEKAFRGYFRWYDYNTDGSPIAGGASWATPPTAGEGAASEFVYNGRSYGWYIYRGGGLDGDANTPVINATWTEQTARTLACDVSAYTDFSVAGDPVYDFDNMTITRSAFTEPTLSYRQIYHLKPAAEMAKELQTKSQKGEYLEVYNYLAPTGKEVLLTTEFRYIEDKATSLSELCYFYNEESPIRVNGKTSSKWWYKDGTQMNTLSYTAAKDYLRVSSTSATSAKYELRVPASETGLGYDLLIAQFNVTFVSDCGPTTNSTPLKTKAEIEADFDVLEYNDFSYGFEPSSTENTHLDYHLPWDQSSYGKMYTSNKISADKFYRPVNAYFPYWGEYTLVNRVTSDRDWADGANHVDNTEDEAAGRQGYALFVDGTQEPGLVASISTKKQVRICEKQNIYCSIWLRNTGIGEGSNPIFRCNVQGRNADDTEWSDVGVFFVGELGNNEDWRQVVFPVMATESYDETRISIYNFANSHSGNDFMIDDITLYTNHLPMSSYQLEPSMIGADNTNPFTMAVLRVEFDERERQQSLYYQIYDLQSDGITKTPVQLTDYITPSASTVPHGCVTIPVYNYNPDTDKNVDSNHKFADMKSFYANVLSNNPTTGICYVNDGGVWVMYIVHAIPKTKATSGPYPYVKTDYGVRMSYSKAEDLGNVNDCSMDMPFATTQETTFELRNALGTGETKEFAIVSNDNCANSLYMLDIKITQDMDPENKEDEKEEGMPYADWLKGIESDEVFADAALANNTDADAQFLTHYGYSRNAVTKAIQDLRKVNKDDVNDNSRTIADASLLTVDHFDDDANLGIIQTLCQKGYLELHRQTVTFYLGAAETARYWVFPIEGTASSAQGNTLHDNPAPKWVQVSSYDSQFKLSIFGYELPDQYSTALPTVRVLKSKMTEEIVIEYENKTFDAGTTQQGDAYLFSTTDMQLSRALGTQVFQYNSTVDNTNHIITLTVPDEYKNTNFTVGSEYAVAVTLRDETGDDTPATGNNGCPVGTWFFNILVIPDVVVWTGGEDAVWCDDANWKGYEENEATHHYAPIEGSGVVIPSDKAPTLTELAIEEAGVIRLIGDHPCPLHLNFPLTPECGQIYFEAGATMENQHLLKHDRAFVDLVVPQGTWNSVAVPLAGVVSGDMFIPHKTTGEYQGESTESTEPFGVTGFNPEGSRLSTSAYAFWQSFFNKTVYMLNENGSKESAISTTTTEFAPTNSMEVALEVGAGHQLLGFGPDPNEENLTIRLPKPDTEYSYYHPNGAAATPTQINRGENAGKLIYNPDQAIALTGETSETKYVMFGNPTMAYIDMQKFLTANAAILQGAYYLMENDSWEAATALVKATETDGYLAPMRSVMLELTSSATGTGATVTLKPEHLVASLPTAPAAAPRRAANINDVQKMVIRADVDGTQAQCIVAANKVANDSYTLSEDALFFSSGVESGVSDVVATSPVNMYTLSERVPMMVDVRKNIDTIPLAMLVMESYQTEMMTLTFDLSADWDKDVYFCDSKTGAKTLIFDGMEIEVELSANHETRYFLEGPDKFEPGNDIWSSTENVKGEINVWAYSPDNGQLVVTSNDILKSVEVYDLSGRLVADKELELQYNSTSLSIPTGAYIVKAALRDNSVHTLSALVK